MMRYTARRQNIGERSAVAMTRWMTTALVALMSLAGAVGDVKANGGRDVGVVVVGPEAPAATLAAIARGAERGALAEGWQARSLEDAALVGRLSECSGAEAGCVAGALGDGGPPRLLFLRFRSESGAGVIDGRLFEVASKGHAAVTQRYCKACDAAEVANLGAEMAGELLRTHGRRSAPATSIRVIASPADAHIWIDREPVGSGGVHLVSPGRHQIEVRREGYLPVVRTVIASEGAVTPVEITLVSRDRRSRWRRAGPYGLGAVGLGAIALGIGYFAINETPGADEPRIEATRDTWTHGVVATAAGAALIGGAVLWWVLDRPGAEDEHSRISILPSPHGAYAWWTLDF
jgi:hypothetical protein